MSIIHVTSAHEGGVRGGGVGKRGQCRQLTEWGIRVPTTQLNSRTVTLSEVRTRSNRNAPSLLLGV